MKAFKKLMAAALVCVMALTMLTGCGVANNQTEKHMVEALNNAAKAAKVSYTYERTDALDKIADSALETAKKNGKIADAEKVSGDYVQNLVSAKGAANPLMFVVLLVGVQGVAEFLVSGILGGIVARAVRKFLK